MAENQGRTLDLLNHIGHGEGLAGAGNTEQGLRGQPLIDTFDKLGDGFGLVTGRFIC